MLCFWSSLSSPNSPFLNPMKARFLPTRTAPTHMNAEGVYGILKTLTDDSAATGAAILEGKTLEDCAQAGALVVLKPRPDPSTPRERMAAAFSRLPTLTRAAFLDVYAAINSALDRGDTAAATARVNAVTYPAGIELTKEQFSAVKGGILALLGA